MVLLWPRAWSLEPKPILVAAARPASALPGSQQDLVETNRRSSMLHEVDEGARIHGRGLTPLEDSTRTVLYESMIRVARRR